MGRGVQFVSPTEGVDMRLTPTTRTTREIGIATIAGLILFILLFI